MNVYMHCLTMIPISLTFVSFVESLHVSAILVLRPVT